MELYIAMKHVDSTQLYSHRRCSRSSASAHPAPASCQAALANGQAAPAIAEALWRHPALPPTWPGTRHPPVFSVPQRQQDEDFRIARRALGAAMPQGRVDQFYRQSLELDKAWIQRGRSITASGASSNSRRCGLLCGPLCRRPSWIASASAYRRMRHGVGLDAMATATCSPTVISTT